MPNDEYRMSNDEGNSNPRNPNHVRGRLRPIGRSDFVILSSFDIRASSFSGDRGGGSNPEAAHCSCRKTGSLIEPKSGMNSADNSMVGGLQWHTDWNRGSSQEAPAGTEFAAGVKSWNTFSQARR